MGLETKAGRAACRPVGRTCTVQKQHMSCNHAQCRVNLMPPQQCSISTYPKDHYDMLRQARAPTAAKYVMQTLPLMHPCTQHPPHMTTAVLAVISMIHTPRGTSIHPTSSLEGLGCVRKLPSRVLHAVLLLASVQCPLTMHHVAMLNALLV